ncbi:MAG TPA: hypothetical protein VKA83_17765 [Methylomirabilota bacterium]|nr:hypothetical protein [Methylomirabilota bacterium]
MDPSAAAPGAATQAPPALGLQAAASQKIVESRKALEAALVVFGSESEEGKALVAAIKALGSIFPGEPMGGAGAAGAPPAGVPLGGPKPGASFGM